MEINGGKYRAVGWNIQSNIISKIVYVPGGTELIQINSIKIMLSPPRKKKFSEQFKNHEGDAAGGNRKSGSAQLPVNFHMRVIHKNSRISSIGKVSGRSFKCF